MGEEELYEELAAQEAAEGRRGAGPPPGAPRLRSRWGRWRLGPGGLGCAPAGVCARVQRAPVPAVTDGGASLSWVVRPCCCLPYGRCSCAPCPCCRSSRRPAAALPPSSPLNESAVLGLLASMREQVRCTAVHLAAAGPARIVGMADWVALMY